MNTQNGANAPVLNPLHHKLIERGFTPVFQGGNCYALMRYRRGGMSEVLSFTDGMDLPEKHDWLRVIYHGDFAEDCDLPIVHEESSATEPFPLDWHIKTADEQEYKRRARAIIDRKMPPITKTYHGFFESEAFVLSSRYNGERELLVWRTYARLRAKDEGGAPYIKLPKDDHALRGGAMWTVAKQLENENQSKER